MEYRVRHRTTYHYAQPVTHSTHLAHLTPRNGDRQTILSHGLTIDPAPSAREERWDYFGNRTEWIGLEAVHDTLEIVAESRVRVEPPPLRDPAQSLAWEELRARLRHARGAESLDAIQYMFDSPLTLFTADLAAYAETSFPAGRPVLAGAIDLMGRIHRDFRYETGVTDATTPVDRVFELRAGVCQDLAHIAIACLRSLGLPARYVSGYLLTEPPPGRQRLLGADASHAWFGVFAPPYGWVDLDPTNDVVVGDGHVVLGHGRDYGDVAPLAGIILGGQDHRIEVGVDVIPATDDVRPPGN
jgi:transglutaminase-like putative cysteine protease